MKKIKKKLIQIILYIICYRNVDRLNNVWIYDSYYIKLGKEEEKMTIEKIKNELLNDRGFREKLFELYYKDDERFINKMLKEASKNKFDTSSN